MARRIFGTDGVRGRTDAWPMTAPVPLRLWRAVTLRQEQT